MVPRLVPLLRLQIARAGAAMGTALGTVVSQTVTVHVHATRHAVLGAGQVILTLRKLLITGVEQSAVKEKSMNGLTKNRCIKKCTGKDIHNATDEPYPRDTVTTTAEKQRDQNSRLQDKGQLWKQKRSDSFFCQIRSKIKRKTNFLFLTCNNTM